MHIEVVWRIELSHCMIEIRGGIPRSFCSFSFIDGADELLSLRDRTPLVQVTSTALENAVAHLRAKLEQDGSLDFDIPASDALSSNSNHQ